MGPFFIAPFAVPLPQAHRTSPQILASPQRSPKIHLCPAPSKATATPPTTPAPIAPDISTESQNLLQWPQLTAHVLNHASTPQGREFLAPSGASLHIGSTRAESELLLAETRELHHLEFQRCKPLSFAGIHDVSDLVRFAAKGGVLKGKELVRVAGTLRGARAMRRQVDVVVADGAELPILKGLVSTFRTWPEVEGEIMCCLDETGDVLESADVELRGIRLGLKEGFAEVRAMLNQIMARQADAIQDRLITQRYDRFVIPVKVSRKGEFRRGVVHDFSSTGSTAYIEPAAVRPINDRLRTLAAQEKARVNAILRRLSVEVVAPATEDICSLATVLGQIDAAAARARCSMSLDAVDVVFDDSKPLKLLGARHPLLLWKAMAEVRRAGQVEDGRREERDPAWKKMVVPSSYVLGEDVRCVCVTGPNTGGKTLSLKTLGTCVLMAKAGMFVPAKRPSSVATMARESGLDIERDEQQELEDMKTARIPYFDSVLADIGDDQSLVQSLSTFSGHVQRIKRILAASTSKTLVLLDEIGSGTDPAEGAALGMAILRHLAIGGRAALTFATTHHGELKTLKYSEDDSAKFFENASVEFDDVRMEPTFKLVWGIPGRSNALAIASRLGLDSRVIDEAEYLLTGSSADGQGSSNRVDIEKMISSLEREKNAAEKAREHAEKGLKEIEGLRAELQDRLHRLTVNEKSLRQDQKEAMDMELSTARKQIAKVIKEMQLGGGSAQAASLASDKLGRISATRVTIDESPTGNQESHEPVKMGDIMVGDKVAVPRLGPGQIDVVEIISQKELMVAIGSMRAKVKVKEVSSVSRPRRTTPGIPSKGAAGRAYKSSAGQSASRERPMLVRTAANTIDIRGERVDSAEGIVDQALDKALAMGSLWIIHGHGTGRLRSGIRDFLQSHTLVGKIEYAEQSEGGTGVTVAYLS